MLMWTKSALMLRMHKFKPQQFPVPLLYRSSSSFFLHSFRTSSNQQVPSQIVKNNSGTDRQPQQCCSSSSSNTIDTAGETLIINVLPEYTLWKNDMQCATSDNFKHPRFTTRLKNFWISPFFKGSFVRTSVKKFNIFMHVYACCSVKSCT